MNVMQRYFVDVKHGTKVTYSESDLRKLDKMYEKEVLNQENRKVRSPARKVLQQAHLTQLRDYAYEKILDDHSYTFSHLLVIPNPYDLVKQSALLLFNSGKETKIRYRVLGDTPAADFCGETDYTTRHRVPVMGLYLERNNQVVLEMIDRSGEVVKKRMLRIYVSESPRKIRDVLGAMQRNEDITDTVSEHFPFLLINGVSFNPLAVDCNGQIRYSIQLRTRNIGMIPLSDGHFLYEDRTVNRMALNGKMRPCRYHEMDYLGRVYRTYLLDYPLSGAVAQGEHSLYMGTSSDAEHMKDSIIELDRHTGEMKKKVDLAEIIGTKYRTRKDWAHISAISYHQGKLLIALRRLHTILEYDWENDTLVWVLASKKIWKKQPIAAYLLTGDCTNASVSWRPDFVSYIDNGVDVQNMRESEKENEESVECLNIFQIRSNAGIKLRNKTGRESSFVSLQINPEKRMFERVFEIPFLKTRLHGSGFFSKDGKGLLLCSGTVAKKTEGKKGFVAEFDGGTQKEIRSFALAKSVNTVWEFEPNISSYGKGVPISSQVVFGTIAPPQSFQGDLPEISEEKLPKEVFSGVHLCEEMYICRLLPGSISRVYFIGKKHAYVQDYSHLLARRRKFPFAISLHEFKKDVYRVYVEYEGMAYLFKNEVRVIEN